MSRLPSPRALRRTAVAGVAGAGFALVGLSFSNVAAMDSTLKAATEQATPPVSARDVSYVPRRDCPPKHDRVRSTTSATHLQY